MKTDEELLGYCDEDERWHGSCFPYREVRRLIAEKQELAERVRTLEAELVLMQTYASVRIQQIEEAEERARVAEADADWLAEALLAQHTTLPITSKTAKATAALGRHREALKTRAANDG